MTSMRLGRVVMTVKEASMPTLGVCTFQQILFQKEARFDVCDVHMTPLFSRPTPNTTSVLDLCRILFVGSDSAVE